MNVYIGINIFRFVCILYFMDIIGEGIVNMLVILYMVIFIKVFIDVIC